MKILIICNNELCYNPRLLKAADYFSGKGVFVTIYNPITGITSKSVYDQAVKNKAWRIIENDFSKRNFYSYINWLRIGLIHKVYSVLWKKFKFKPVFDKQFNKGLIGFNLNITLPFDYVLINLVDNLPFACKIKQRTGAKIIYDSQEYFVGQYQKYPEEKLAWVIRAEKTYIKLVDVLISTTNVMKERLIFDYQITIPSFRVRNLPSAKMLIVKNEKRIKKSNAAYLVWHGMGIYLNNCRGVHILLQAIAKCTTNVVFVLQGNLVSEQMLILNKYINDLSLDNKIIILPPADPYAIVDSLRFYDIGLIGELPEEDNQLLTSSNKLFDYINAGLAIIAPDLPGLNETVKEKNLGLIYEPGNIDDLARKIDFLVNNPKELNKYKIKANDISKKELYWENDFDNVWNYLNI
jgi:glycosyltransferase involved in cell wall biosynthesis